MSQIAVSIPCHSANALIIIYTIRVNVSNILVMTNIHLKVSALRPKIIQVMDNLTQLILIHSCDNISRVILISKLYPLEEKHYKTGFISNVL